MGYNYSDLDRKNLNWFPNDNTRATLLTIQIPAGAGKIRGIKDFAIDFKYPIIAIAGRNGSGKTTVLALAACAYHNSRSGFRLPGRKTPYYTFSDFFLQTPEDVPVGGIIIRYQILHNNWKPTTDMPTGVGPGWQTRVKRRRDSRWNNYDRRARRTVVYQGINRIVPHAEQSVSKSYRRLFKSVKAKGWEAKVKAIVGRILGADYDGFEHKQHSKYRLPVVKRGRVTYSGFNMGAGEDSLFELFSIIEECPDGSLLLIDELELGLHEDAQSRLIQELKELCNQRKFQVICTTHSPRVLECLPPEGRVFLEQVGENTYVTPGISPAYATGKLSGRLAVELDVLVEDEVPQLIVETALNQELRPRVRVMPVGSSSAVMRHLAVRYKEKQALAACALLDGDQLPERQYLVKEFLDALEQPQEGDTAKQWAESRLQFLPGNEWPELWAVSQQTDATYGRLEREFQLPRDRANELLQAARRAGKHNEFYEAARILNFDQKIVTHQFVKSALESDPAEVQRLRDFVSGLLA